MGDFCTIVIVPLIWCMLLVEYDCAPNAMVYVASVPRAPSAAVFTPRMSTMLPKIISVTPVLLPVSFELSNP